MLYLTFTGPILAKRATFTVQLANMSSGDTKLITYDELNAVKDNKTVLVIDVREPEELKETGVIPGSINIPCQLIDIKTFTRLTNKFLVKELENTLKLTSDEKFLSKYDREKPKYNTPLVFSCKAGIRSENAQNIALKLGYSKYVNFLI